MRIGNFSRAVIFLPHEMFTHNESPTPSRKLQPHHPRLPLFLPRVQVLFAQHFPERLEPRRIVLHAGGVLIVILLQEPILLQVVKQVAGLRVKIAGPAQLAVTMSSALGVIDGVVKLGGKIIAGAMVVLVPDDPANHPQWFRRDQSDSDGTFTLSQVLPGKYTAVAIENGWNLEWANPTIIQPYLTNGEVVQVGPNQRSKVAIKLQ